MAAARGAAPSLHNSQPWRFRAAPDRTGLLVLADLSRAVQATDLMGRALHVSIGAAVLNIRVAAAELGLTAGVRLFPDPPHADGGQGRPAREDPVAELRSAAPISSPTTASGTSRLVNG